jgi:hypothetical protein
MTHPVLYRIQVKEALSPEWAAWFAPLTVASQPDGGTLLSGELPDQAALHGALIRIRDLGLTLVSLYSVDLDPAVTAASRS